MIEHLPILQVVLPLLAAPVCLLLRHAGRCWWLAMAVSTATLATSSTLMAEVYSDGPLSYYLGGWAAPWGIEYRIDRLNALVLLIVSGISTVVLLFARHSLQHEVKRNRHYIYYTAWMLCLCGLLGMSATGDVFNIFVFLEITSLSMYLMIGLGHERRALTAAFSYLIMGTIGATFFLIGVALLYAVTGTLNLADLASRLADIESSRSVVTAFAFIVLGMGVKAAAFPVHWWLPNAYRYAPTSATALLGGTATKVAVYLLARFVYELFGTDFSFEYIRLTEMLLASGVAAAVLMSAVAIFEDDVKKLFAWSSIAQIGYMVIGLSLASAAGVTATMLHLFNHAIIKTALFMALGAAFVRTGGFRLEHIQGLGRYMPWTMAALLIAGLSLVGVPLTAGFISKWYLILAALEQNLMWLALVVVASSLLALIYVWRVIEAGYFRPVPEHVSDRREAPMGLLVPLWILVLANLYFGVETSLNVGAASGAAEALTGAVR
ncbi:MAG TPA: monovalent cation/H+ antiporter subunit D family protein [Arenicellales bacterium]|nr:monovalent cation/H+ antiporter subunit D family protein [Arenicellales bacterium]